MMANLDDNYAKFDELLLDELPPEQRDVASPGQRPGGVEAREPGEVAALPRRPRRGPACKFQIVAGVQAPLASARIGSSPTAARTAATASST